VQRARCLSTHGRAGRGTPGAPTPAHPPRLQAIHAAIRTFLDELAAGGPMQGTAGGGSAPGAPTTNGAAPPAAAVAAAAPPAQKRVPPAAPAASTSAHTGSCSFTEQYYCRPADLYECFTTEGKLRAWTQSAATVSAAPGGQFTWFGGGVQVSASPLALLHPPPAPAALLWGLAGCLPEMPEPSSGVMCLTPAPPSKARRSACRPARCRVSLWTCSRPTS
jgi:hypothetical protein